MTNTLRLKLYVSDRAWQGLLSKSHRARNVTPYLTRLPVAPSAYSDTRPQWMKDMDHDMLVSNKMPMWSYEEPRREHTITITREAFAVLSSLTSYWHITNHLRADGVNRRNSRIAAILEALGSDLLTPTEPVEVPTISQDNLRRAEAYRNQQALQSARILI